MRLFLERGFDRVSVAQIAAAAGVAEKTVFNYFPSKAMLVFDEGDDLLAELLHTMRTRPVGESALSAVRGFVAGLPEWAAHRRPVRPGKEFRGLIADSPALQAHRRLMFSQWEASLASLLAEQTGSSPDAAEPFVAAVALIGVLRAVFEASASDNENNNQCLDLLAEGLDRYARASVSIDDRPSGRLRTRSASVIRGRRGCLAGMHLEQFALVVDDYDDAIRFFVDVLGFELVEDSPSLTNDGRLKRWVVVRPPGGTTALLLAQADGERQARAVGDQFAGRVGLFLRVDDFEGAYDRMRKAGVEFLTKPRQETYGEVAVFLDVAGNHWDLLGPPSSP